MELSSSPSTVETWLATHGEKTAELAKASNDTRAWLTAIDGVEVFAKWYPSALISTSVQVEMAISGGNLHKAIVPLRRILRCSDGDLLIYDRAPGENLASQESRKRFSLLPTSQRVQAALTVCDALAAVSEAGFMIIDWHEGNMHYDFERHQTWLFDWDLCLPRPSFVLKMDFNYGSSRLMAPEEFVRGSTIDQTTLVFNVGRFVLLYLPELADSLADVLAVATHPRRIARFQTLREFGQSLKRAL